jgi:hypothetical protein
MTDSMTTAPMIKRRGRMRIRSRDMTRRIISVRESTEVKNPSSSIFLLKTKTLMFSPDVLQSSCPRSCFVKTNSTPYFITCVRRYCHRGRRTVQSCHALRYMVHIVEVLSTCSLACKLAASEHQRDGGALLPDVRRETQKLLDGRAALG